MTEIKKKEDKILLLLSVSAKKLEFNNNFSNCNF